MPSLWATADVGQWMIALGILVLIIAPLVLLSRMRERRGDWGPGFLNVPKTEGYAPADLRGGYAAAPVRSPAPDPQDRWLLGLAAPHVESVGLLHERWSLVPAPCPAPWRRRLFEIASLWQTVRAKEWKARTTWAEGKVERARTATELASAVAQYAMILRLGVGARHISGRRARARLFAAAAPLRREMSDWLAYGDAIVMADAGGPAAASRLRADLRVLYAPDGPWHDIAWPAR